jgi:branched-chain amino acid aminotransferase
VDDRLVTPPLADGALGGVARACLLEGGVVQEASLVPDDLRRAEAMFLCNSLGVRSITRLDGQVVRSQPDCRLRLQRLIERDDQD